MEGIRRALVLGLVLIAGPAIEQAPSVGPRMDKLSGCILRYQMSDSTNVSHM